MGKYPWIRYLLLIVATVAGYWFYSRVYGMINYRVIAFYPLLLFPTTFTGVVYSTRNKRYGGLILCGAAALSLPIHEDELQADWKLLSDEMDYFKIDPLK